MEEANGNGKHKKVPTWLKLAGLAIPVLIPSVFNFFVAKMETDRANERAAMAYEALVGSVSKLQEAVEKLSEVQQDLKVTQAELKGRVEAGERFRARSVPQVGMGGGVGSGVRKAPAESEGIPEPPVQLERLPNKLETLEQLKK